MIARSLRCFAIAAGIAACSGSLALAAPATVGVRAPPFELESLTGKPVPSSQFRGRALYINLFASWCPPCRLEMPLIVRTLPRYAKRVNFLAVDAQEPSAIIRPYLAQARVRAQVAIDHGQFAASYGARSIPESVFIDRHGVVRAIVHGPIDKATLQKYLALIAG